jgi:membrane-associated phospholipid phosphatase
MPDTLSLPVRIAILLFGLLLWLAQYFLINRSTPHKTDFKNWALAFESAIPFMPQMVFPYLSVYIFVLLPFLLVAETSLYFYSALAYAIVTLIGSGIHITFPSRVTRVEDFNPHGISLKTLRWYQNLCKPYDNFPSTHVAFSILVVGIAYLSSGLTLALIFAFWALLIALSTLLTKQHYLLDILSGFVLGASALSVILLLY